MFYNDIWSHSSQWVNYIPTLSSNHCIYPLKKNTVAKINARCNFILNSLTVECMWWNSKWRISSLCPWETGPGLMTCYSHQKWSWQLKSIKWDRRWEIDRQLWRLQQDRWLRLCFSHVLNMNPTKPDEFTPPQTHITRLLLSFSGCSSLLLPCCCCCCCGKV